MSLTYLVLRNMDNSSNRRGFLENMGKLALASAGDLTGVSMLLSNANCASSSGCTNYAYYIQKNDEVYERTGFVISGGGLYCSTYKGKDVVVLLGVDTIRRGSFIEEARNVADMIARSESKILNEFVERYKDNELFNGVTMSLDEYLCRKTNPPPGFHLVTGISVATLCIYEKASINNEDKTKEVIEFLKNNDREIPLPKQESHLR